MNNQAAIQTGLRQWAIDPAHSEIAFSVRHMMISTVRGHFTGVRGTAEFDPEDIESGSVSVEIDTDSIDTREETRDGHLRSADFLDVETYPTITFESRTVESAGGNRYRITGDLTIRGTTRPVTLDAEFSDVVPDPFGGTRLAISASTRINRADFGLSWNQALETGGVLVSENVDIEINGQLVAS